MADHSCFEHDREIATMDRVSTTKLSTRGQVVVSGDDDLLPLKEWYGIEILSLELR